MLSNKKMYLNSKGAKNDGGQQQNNVLSSQEISLLLANSMEKNNYQTSLHSPLNGLPAQIVKPIPSSQPIMVLQEQPVNIKSLTNQPISNKNITSLLAKTTTVNQQKISHELNYSLLPQSTSQGSIQNVKLKDNKKICMEGQQNLQKNHNIQQKQINNSINQNQDQLQLSGKIITKHQRHCSEAVIPKNNIISNPATMQNLQNKEHPANKENQVCYVPFQEQQGQRDVILNTAVEAKDKQNHSRKNSLNMLSQRQPNTVDIDQQFLEADLLKFQTYDHRRETRDNLYSMDIPLKLTKNPISQENKKVDNKSQVSWDNTNFYLQQELSSKSNHPQIKTVSSDILCADSFNHTVDQSQQYFRQNIPPSGSSSKNQIGQNISSTQLPRSTSFNAIYNHNISGQSTVQGQIHTQSQRQFQKYNPKQQQQQLSQQNNSQPMHNISKNHPKNKNEGSFQYKGQDFQELNQSQPQLIIENISNQTNKYNNNYAVSQKRNNSQIISQGLVPHNLDNEDSWKSYQKQQTYPLSANNTIPSNPSSQNNSQILGQNSSSSSKSPNQSSTQKVFFCNQQVNISSKQNLNSCNNELTNTELQPYQNYISTSANAKVNGNNNSNQAKLLPRDSANLVNSSKYPNFGKEELKNIQNIKNLTQFNQNNNHSLQNNLTFAEQLKIEKTKKISQEQSNQCQFLQSMQEQLLARSKQQSQSCNNSTNNNGSDKKQLTPFCGAKTATQLTKDLSSLGKIECPQKQLSGFQLQDHSRKESVNHMIPQSNTYGMYETIPQYESISPLACLDADSKYYTLQYGNDSKSPFDYQQIQYQKKQPQQGTLSNLTETKQIYDYDQSISKTLSARPAKSGTKASHLNQDEDLQGNVVIHRELQRRKTADIVEHNQINWKISNQQDILSNKVILDTNNLEYLSHNSSTNKINKDSNRNMNNNNNQQLPINTQIKTQNQQNLPKWYLYDSQGDFETKTEIKPPEMTLKSSTQDQQLLESLSILKQGQLIQSIQIAPMKSESSSITQVSTQNDELSQKYERLLQNELLEGVPVHSYHQRTTEFQNNDKTSEISIPLESLTKYSGFNANLQEISNNPRKNNNHSNILKPSTNSSKDNIDIKQQGTFPEDIVCSSIESIPLYDNQISEKNNPISGMILGIDEKQIQQNEQMLNKRDEDYQINEDEDNLIDFAELVCEEGDIAEELRGSESIGFQASIIEGQIETTRQGFYNMEPHSSILSTQLALENLTIGNGLGNGSQISSIGSYNLNNFQQETKEQKESRIKRELNEFAAKENEYPIFGSDNLEYLVMRDADYAADPNYLIPDKQANITVNMRAILLDWMMEVSEEFGLKRETYHIAVNLVDRYLSNSLHIKKRDLQLLGVTSLYISSKLEEIFPPKIGDFVCSTNNGYKPEEINQFELKILQALKFMINPPTLSMWSNWFMSQWDIFMATSEKVQESLLASQSNVLFKQPDEHSYLLFREFMQAVDVSVLDITSLQCDPRYMLASIMYIVLGKGFGLLDSATVTEQFTQGNLFFSRSDEFNDIFDDFAKLSFGFPLSSILQTIQYVALFFEVPLNQELPSSAKNDKDNVFKGYYEDFLAFQTHNKEQLQIIQRKL